MLGSTRLWEDEIFCDHMNLIVETKLQRSEWKGLSDELFKSQGRRVESDRNQQVQLFQRTPNWKSMEAKAQSS